MKIEITKNTLLVLLIGTLVIGNVLFLRSQEKKIDELERMTCLTIRSQIRDFLVSESSRLSTNRSVTALLELQDGSQDYVDSIMKTMELKYIDSEDDNIISDMFKNNCSDYRVDTYNHIFNN